MPVYAVLACRDCQREVRIEATRTIDIACRRCGAVEFRIVRVEVEGRVVRADPEDEDAWTLSREQPR